MRRILTVVFFCLVLCADAQAATPRKILRWLDDVNATSQQEAHGGDPFVAALLQAIADSYGVKDVTELHGRLYFALITSTEITTNTRFYVFTDPNERHSAASTIKLALLARLLADIQKQPDPTKWGMGGTDWGPIAKRMIAQSDNAAANKILGRYGIEGMNDWLAGLGFSASELSFGREFQGAPPAKGKDNYATAAGLAKLLFLLAQKEDVDDLLKEGMLWKAQSMLDSTGDNNNLLFNDRLNAQFPKGVAFLHKTGSNAAVLGDGGIVRDGEREYIIVAFDTKSDRKAMQRLGRNLFDLMAGE